MLVDLDDLPPCASDSKNSDHKPPNDSPRPLFSDAKNSVDNDGVLGVRCQGDIGVRRLGLETPGLAKPADSLWSIES